MNCLEIISTFLFFVIFFTVLSSFPELRVFLGPPSFLLSQQKYLADSLCIFLLSDYHSPQLWKSSLKLWPLLCLSFTFSLSMQPVSHYLLARPTSLAHHLYLTIHINSHIELADHRPQVFQGKPFLASWCW